MDWAVTVEWKLAAYGLLFGPSQMGPDWSRLSQKLELKLVFPARTAVPTGKKFRWI